MIGGMFNLARWEWFKLQRRWMPWILLVILILISQLAVWGQFFTYNNLRASGGAVPLPSGLNPGQGAPFQTVSCKSLQENPQAALPEGTPPEVATGLLAQCQQLAGLQQEQLLQQYDGFTLPGSLTSALRVSQQIGLLLLGVLTASAIGSDYGLGTLRPILVRGPGRLPYLGGKFLMLIAAAAAALLVACAGVVISSVIAGLLAVAPDGFTTSITTWSDAGIALVKTWGSFIPYVMLASTLTVLTRSTAAGMAISLVYLFAEGLLVSLITTLFDWFESVGNYLLIHNIDVLASSVIPGATAEGNLSQAIAILLAYTVALAALGIWLFQKRDVSGASGG